MAQTNARTERESAKERGYCPLAIFQAASRERARLTCLGNECAWYMGDRNACAIWVIAAHMED